MNPFYILSAILFVAFVGLSIDIIRSLRRLPLASIVTDEKTVDRELTTELDAEQIRDNDTGWDAPDFFIREDFKREIPRHRDEIISLTATILPENSKPLIICPPTVDGMTAAATLLRHIYWSRVRVIYKDFLVKSIYKLTRLKPQPDYLIIIGMSAGYVHGRRFLQALTRIKEMGITIAWYDNHEWLPVIAKNISDLCFDFVLVDPAVSSTELIRRRFHREQEGHSDENVDLIASIAHVSPLRRAASSWTEKWYDLIEYHIVEGSWVSRSRIVRRLSDMSRLNLLDHLALLRYQRRRLMTLDIIKNQTCFIELTHGRRMSVLDLRPMHREQSANGKVFFVFRGKKPVLEMPRFVFQDHGSDCLVMINSLNHLEILARPDSDIRLTRLIDITLVNGKSVRIDGHDSHVNVHFNLPPLYRYRHNLTFRWTPEIPALLESIASRL